MQGCASTEVPAGSLLEESHHRCLTTRGRKYGPVGCMRVSVELGSKARLP